MPSRPACFQYPVGTLTLHFGHLYHLHARPCALFHSTNGDAIRLCGAAFCVRSCGQAGSRRPVRERKGRGAASEGPLRDPISPLHRPATPVPLPRPCPRPNEAPHGLRGMRRLCATVPLHEPTRGARAAHVRVTCVRTSRRARASLGQHSCNALVTPHAALPPCAGVRSERSCRQ